MSSTQEMEKRVFQLHGLEVRAAEGDEPAVLRGYAAVFNQRSVNLGGFVEEIEPGAFAATLAAGPDVRATIDHEGGLTTLGRTKNNTLKLWEDDQGLGMQIIPPDTQAGRDVVTLVQRGDVDQMSFMFRVPKGGDEWWDENGLTVRTLHQIDLDDGDVSIVTYPAYPQTSVSAEARDMAARRAAAANGNKAGNGAGAQARQARKRRLAKLELKRRV